MSDLIDSCEGNVCQHTKQKRACVRYRGEHVHADILEQIHLAASTRCVRVPPESVCVSQGV